MSDTTQEDPDEITVLEGVDIFVLIERDLAQGGFRAECMVGNIYDVRDPDIEKVILKVLQRLHVALVPVLEGEQPMPCIEGEVLASWLDLFVTRFPDYQSASVFFGNLEGEEVEGFPISICLDPSCPILDLQKLASMQANEDEVDASDDMPSTSMS